MRTALRRDKTGQALAEMVLAVPLLFLMAAGTFQFIQVFLARAKLEHACGVVMRQWAAGVRRDSTVEEGIWAALGPDRIRFDRSTLRLTASSRSLDAPAVPAGAKDGLPDSDSWVKGGIGMGTRWEVRVRCRPVPLFSRFLRDGIPFTIRCAAIPGRPLPGAGR